MIGSEAVPFAKTGGLADVLGALPPALARLGWDVTLALPRYRGVTAGSLVESFPVTVGGYAREVGFFEAAMRGRRARAARRLPGSLRSRGAVRRRQHAIPGQPAALRDAGSRGARVRRAARRGALGRPRARLAGGARAGLSEDAVRGASRAGRHAERLHDSQSRVSGVVCRRLAAAARPGLGAVRHRAAGILGPHQLPEGRHQRRADDHDRQPALRHGDSDAGVRLRLRRHPARAARRSGRHPERHRHRAVGSGARSVSAGAVQRGRPGRQGGRRRLPCSRRYSSAGRRQRGRSSA